MRVFRALGKLVSVSDIEIQNYSANAGGPNTGVFLFKGDFENAKTLVTITIQEEEGIIRVDGFHINTLSEISGESEFKA